MQHPIETARPVKVLLLLAWTLRATSLAQDYTYTTNAGTITIMGYTGPGGAIIIPSTINDLPVARIDNSAFYNNSSLTSITIPHSVTNIGDVAFERCTSLITITVDEFNAFYSSLAGVLFNKSQTTLIQYPGGKPGNYLIPDSVTSIGSEAFYDCRRLTSVTIPNTVTSIRGRTFYDCTSLTNVEFSDSITTIEIEAFYDCNSLTSITIPDSVANIGGGAFSGCSSLASITIPSSVTNIGGGAFSYCRSLSAITVDEFNAFYSSVDGILFDKSQRTLIQCPASKAGNYTVPKSVTTIGQGAFARCSWLTSVTIPSSVTTIGNSAFTDCIRITGFYFNGNAPSVGPFFVFDNLHHATAYYLPGTAGWGSTFGGYIQHGSWQFIGSISTAYWILPNPQILNIGSSLGLRTNQFGFIISWATNASVAVEACTNLGNSIWSPLATNHLTDGWSYFSDPEWTNHRARFYRLRWP